MAESTAQPKQIGIYNLNMASRGGGEKLTLVLASHLSRSHRVTVFHNSQLDIQSLQETFAVDLSRVSFTEFNPFGLAFRALAKVRGRRVSPFWLNHYQQLKRLKLDLLVNVSYGSVLPCPAAKGMFICMFPHDFRSENGRAGVLSMRRRLVNGIEKTFAGKSEKSWLDSYTEVIAISNYSAEWIQRLWGRQSHVVYPPSDDVGPATTKEQMILQVGRFTPSSAYHHHKAQDTLLTAFKKMKDCHRSGWELHFAGTAGSDYESSQFTRSLMRQAEGLPVKFHFNAKFDELRDLYRRAAIYWHATGAGIDADAHPELQEHFGMTTVEAMSAGAVPVVIGSGGQKEIVTHGINGLCWNGPAELVEQTEMLIRDLELRKRLSTAAIASSRKYSRAAFTTNMDHRIAQAFAGQAICAAS